MWDPNQYQRYSDERSRAFYDLVERVRVRRPQLVYDLGCGPGALTASLARRWPSARVVGVDNDEAMLSSAAEHENARVSFERGDLASFVPPADADVVVSNAAYHWVEDHPGVLARIAARLPENGWLAIQVPGNFAAPSHTIIRELLDEPEWVDRLGGRTTPAHPVLDAAAYGDIFAGQGLTIDTWETTYNQVLAGESPVLEWVRGSTLRPVLDRLDAGAQAELLSRLRSRYAAAYPRSAAGVVLPFRRIFAVGRREPVMSPRRG